MSKDDFKAEYIEYEDGTRVLLDEDDVPELTDEFFKNARPAREVLTEIWGAEATEAFLKENREHLAKRGRPRKPAKARARPATIRLSPEVDAYFRSQGKGWQTRVNEVLKIWVRENPL